VNRRQLLGAAAGLATGSSPFAAATEHLERVTASGEVSAAVLQVEAPGRKLLRAFGRASAGTPFLIASVTKPMTAAVLMSLVEKKRLGLDDPVRRHLPGFASGEVTVRHLLCHTSGLPDMLPDNLELRRRHAPLAEFVAGACQAPLLFPPGSQVRYQSMGLLLAAEIARRLAGDFPELMRRTLFAPLGMKDSALGLGKHRLEDTARCQVPDDPAGWNSPYWRNLGSPWGGAHATAADLTRLLRFFAHPDGRGPLSPASVATMLATQTPPAARERYGLGWRLGLHGRERTFGHSGATGTVAWFDPTRELSFVLLTTLPSAKWTATVLSPVGQLVSDAA
jgi:CubicO group peptidase (beta-lactamase class C family)